jgi:hypothetical protein
MGLGFIGLFLALENPKLVNKDHSLCGPYPLFLHMPLCMEAGNEVITAILLSRESASTHFILLYFS